MQITPFLLTALSTAAVALPTGWYLRGWWERRGKGTVRSYDFVATMHTAKTEKAVQKWELSWAKDNRIAYKHFPNYITPEHLRVLGEVARANKTPTQRNICRPYVPDSPFTKGAGGTWARFRDNELTRWRWVQWRGSHRNQGCDFTPDGRFWVMRCGYHPDLRMSENRPTALAHQLYR